MWTPLLWSPQVVLKRHPARRRTALLTAGPPIGSNVNLLGKALGRSTRSKLISVKSNIYYVNPAEGVGPSDPDD